MLLYNSRQTVTKTKSRIIFCFCACIAFSGNAQEIDYGSKEVGLDLIGIVFPGTGVQPSFFFKNLKLTQKENSFGLQRRGYRVRLGYWFNQPNQRVPNPQLSGTSALNNDRVISDNRVLFRVGYEWRRKIRGIELFYGADFHFDRSFTKSQISDRLLVPSTRVDVEYKSRQFNVGLAPVGGFYYFFNSSYGLSIESTLLFLYSDSLETATWTDPQTQITQESVKQGRGFYFQSIPFYTVNLIIKF
jgi:hypothetical protein